MKPERNTIRGLVLGGLAMTACVLIVGSALAGGGHYFAPVTDPLTRDECGSCYLAFAPSMLPARSWQKMMGNLDNHFGDDASLDAATVESITRYLTANAGDTGGSQYSRKLLKGVGSNSTPQRITELPAWVHEHRKVPAWEWRHKDVLSKANCTACHADAGLGYYDE